MPLRAHLPVRRIKWTCASRKSEVERLLIFRKRGSLVVRSGRQGPLWSVPTAWELPSQRRIQWEFGWKNSEWELRSQELGLIIPMVMQSFVLLPSAHKRGVDCKETSLWPSLRSPKHDQPAGRDSTGWLRLGIKIRTMLVWFIYSPRLNAKCSPKKAPNSSYTAWPTVGNFKTDFSTTKPTSNYFRLIQPF